MATLRDVAARLRAVLASCDRADEHMQVAGEHFRSAIETLALALDGARDRDSIALFERAIDALRVAGEAVGNAGRGVRRQLERYDQDGSCTPRPAVRPAGDRVSAERIGQLRSELPPPVTSGVGKKTHGRWVGSDGQVRAMTSGKDEAYAQAIEVFREMKSRHIPQRAADVEMKLAAHMRKNGIRSATLVINHVPCVGPLGCDALVPVILPVGYRLTVHGANGIVREYKGGATSSWVP